MYIPILGHNPIIQSQFKESIKKASEELKLLVSHFEYNKTQKQMNKKLINQLQNGEIAVKNDGTLEELREVLKVAFPDDPDTHELEEFIRLDRVYSKSEGYDDSWIYYNPCEKVYEKLTKVSVKDFFKPDEPTLEELIKMLYEKAKEQGFKCDVVVEGRKEIDIGVQYVGQFIEENIKNETNELNIQFKITGGAFFNPNDLALHIKEYLENH